MVITRNGDNLASPYRTRLTGRLALNRSGKAIPLVVTQPVQFFARHALDLAFQIVVITLIVGIMAVATRPREAVAKEPDLHNYLSHEVNG